MQAILVPEEAAAAIEKLLDDRGAILTAFAQVEWFLAKLVTEAAKYEQYQTLNLSFSVDAEKRAERLKAVLNVNGPFSAYADQLNKHIDTVIKHVSLRTMAAHGLMVRPNNLRLDSVIHFRMYRMYKGGELVEEVENLTIKEYTDRTAELTGAAREFCKLVRKVWSNLKLDHLDPE